MTKKAELYKALATFSASIKGIEKDARNSFHKYEYTSSERMMATVRSHLLENGLVFIPLSSEIREGQVASMVNGKQGPVEERTAILRQTFRIAHENGEHLDMVKDWPIAPERGRPMDKACAAADTTSISYFLRALGLIPRGDESEELDYSGRSQPVHDGPEPEQPKAKPKKQEVKPRSKTETKSATATVLAYCSELVKLDNVDDVPKLKRKFAKQIKQSERVAKYCKAYTKHFVGDNLDEDEERIVLAVNGMLDEAQEGKDG